MRNATLSVLQLMLERIVGGLCLRMDRRRSWVDWWLDGSGN